MHFGLQRAFDAVDAWVREGVQPPSAARLDADADAHIVPDELGIAGGGVRSPWVDAPYAVFSGLGQPDEMSALFGTARPIDPQKLAARYPGSRDDFVSEFRDATDAAVHAGFLLARDADEVA